MIPLAEITGEKNSDAQTKYNRRIPLSQIVGDTAPQAEPEETGGGFWDTAKNLFNFTPAGVAYNIIKSPAPHFAGGLLAETAGNVSERLGKEFPENSWRRRALDTASAFAQNITDAALQNAQNQLEVGNDNTFSGAIGNRFVSSSSGLLGNAASFLHADKTADAAIEASEATANKNRVSTDDLGEYFTNPRGFASDATEQLTSTAMIAPFMALFPEAAAARAVATFGGDAITQALINRGLYGAAKIFAGGAPRAVQYGFTSAPIEGFGFEGGETRRELLNQGASEEEATKESFITGLKNVPLLLATNTLEGLAFFSPLKVSNKALQIAGRSAVNSAQEQYEEFAQEGIQNAARGEPYSWLPWNGAPNQYEAAERVRYPAALLGGIGGATQAISGTDENQENWKRGDQTSNLTAKQAEVWNAAQYASARAKEKFGYDISPELIYKQWAHESGGTNFDSENVRYNNNFGGLTQVEPNGEENKQRDGNNYYRHFSNVWEYADAYVDDFIKYYPEISGTKNEREFAGVLKKYGYFGDDLENYVAGMEGIQAPANRTSGNQPRIDFASGLQSAREALDGKQMENGTVGCVEAVTKILSHVHPEFKKMVDDGVVNTVEGENSLHSRLEQMGVEIIPFDESKVAQGDIIFYDGKQTYQHVLVADHKDADGNWRVFGNSSSANKVMEQPLYQGQTPAWIAKVSNLQGANVQTQQTRQKETQEAEPTKPLFDLNSEDSTTQKLLEQFANERFESAIKNEDGETADFFNAMFDDDSKFQDTPENRQAIATRYGDELNAFVQKNSQTPPRQKPAETKGKAKQESQYDRNTALIQTGRKYLDELLKKGDEPSRKTAWTLNSAIQNNDLAKVENILKQNNVAIPEQPQPVEENEPPENILSPKSSPNDKKIKVASAQVKTGNKGKKSRQKQGQALIDLAAQNGIEIPNPEVIALKQGSTKAVQKWRDNLMQAGVFKTTAPQSQKNSPTLKERAKPLIERFKAQQKLEREADLTNEDDDESRFVFPSDNSAELESRNEREDEHLLRLEGEYWRLGEEEQRLDRLREEGRRQRDLERARLKSANRNAKITAGKEILRTLRSPKYSEVKAKVEATSGLAKALENGSVEAIRQVRNFIAEVDDKALQESQARQAQARAAQEQRITQIRANRRRSGAQTAQADEQARQAQEEYQRRQAAQSQQAGEQAQLGLGQAQANDFQQQRTAQRQADQRYRRTQTAQADEQARQAQEQYRLRQAAQSQQAGEQAQLGLGQAQANAAQRRIQSPPTREQTTPQTNAKKSPSPEEALKQAGITKPTHKNRWTTQIIQGEKIEPRYSGKWFTFINDRTDNIRRGTGATRRESNSKLLDKISGKIATLMDVYGGKGFNFTNDSFIFDSREDAENFATALNHYFGNTEFLKQKAKQSKKVAALHAKFKTDTHPLIGAHLDKVLAFARGKENTPERAKSIKELKMYEKEAVTDEWLDETEARLQRRETELGNRSETEPLEQESAEQTTQIEPEQEDNVAPSGRKRDLNEIFTSPEGVARILDSLKKENPKAFTNPTQTFIDPAAGEGAITTAVLSRKLNSQARKTSGTTLEQLQRNMLKALSSVYSVELHADNVAELKKNMQKVFLDHYREQIGEDLNKNTPLFKKMQEIIDANNIQGDYLELMEGNAEKLNEAFREWSDEDLSLNDVANKSEIEPTQAESEQEVSEEPKPKRQKNGKWHTVGSSPSRAELQKLIREFYFNDKMVIEDDGTIRNGKNGKTADYVVRVTNNGRWQFGYYETKSEEKTTQAESEQESDEKVFSEEEKKDVLKKLFYREPVDTERLRKTLLDMYPKVKEAINVLERVGKR